MACYRPLWDGGENQFPCRMCVGCRLDRSVEWAIRGVHESQTSKTGNWFATLTYDDEKIPTNYSVSKREVQNFCKRLRNRVGSFRYMASGEYGSDEKGARPHYHVLLFGCDLRDLIPTRPIKGKPYWRSGELEESWTKGISNITEVNFRTARYVARYVLKKQNSVRDRRSDIYQKNYERLDKITGEVWKVKPEFSLMSRNPGLGQEWICRYFTDVYPSDEIIIEGKKYGVPEYYDKICEEVWPEMLETVKAARRERAALRVDKVGDSRVAEATVEARERHYARGREF